MAYSAVAYTCLACYFVVFVTANTSLNDILFNGDFDFFDLTFQFDKNTIYWPDGKDFAFTKKIESFQEDNSWYAANDFEAAEHGGTHIDAPYHFQAKGKHVAEIPIEKLIVPRISEEVAEWITSSYKNIVGIGVDTASLDPGSSKDFAAHKITTKAGLYILENVKLEEPIPEYGCTALILPMKIASGSGAPLRLVAICPKQIPVNFH